MCLMCLFMVFVPAFASVQQDASLTVAFEKEGSNVKIDGASISVYKVADLDFVQNQAQYTLVPEYESFREIDDKWNDVTFDGMTAEESNALAKEMAKTATKAVSSGVTDENGLFNVGNLPAGMYLVGQTGKSGTAEEYKAFDPFLVSVPLYDKESQMWVRDVTAQPKTTVEKMPEEKPQDADNNGGSSTTANESGSSTTNTSKSGSSSTNLEDGRKTATRTKTGDPTNIWFWVRMLSVSGCMVVCISLLSGLLRKKEGNRRV